MRRHKYSQLVDAVPAVVRVVEDARNQLGMSRLRTRLALSLTILVFRPSVSGGAAGAVPVMARGAGPVSPGLVPGLHQRVGKCTRRSSQLEGFLLAVSGSHQFLDAMLLTKERIAL